MITEPALQPGFGIVTLAHGIYTNIGTWSSGIFGWLEVATTELRTENGAKWVLIVKKSNGQDIVAIIPGCQVRGITFTSTCPQPIPDFSV